MAHVHFGPAALIPALRQLWRVGQAQPPKQSPAVSSHDAFNDAVVKAVLEALNDAGRPEVIAPDSPLTAAWRKEYEDNLRRAILNRTALEPDWQHELGERAKAGMRVAAFRGSATDLGQEFDKQKMRVLALMDLDVTNRPPPGLLLPDLERYAGIYERNLPGLRRRGYGDDELAAAWHQAREAIDRARLKC